MEHGDIDPEGDLGGIDDVELPELTGASEATEATDAAGARDAADATSSDRLLAVRAELDTVGELSLDERAEVFERTHEIVVEELRALELG